MKDRYGKELPTSSENKIRALKWYDTIDAMVEVGAKHLKNTGNFLTIIYDKTKKKYALTDDFETGEAASRMNEYELVMNEALHPEIAKYVKEHNMEYHPFLEVARKMGYKK